MTDSAITHVVLVDDNAELRNAAGETVATVPADKCDDMSDHLLWLYEAWGADEPYDSSDPGWNDDDWDEA